MKTVKHLIIDPIGTPAEARTPKPRATGKTGSAVYCAACGCHPPTNNRRRSTHGRKLMVCSGCYRQETGSKH